jgi:cytoplasmic iron level regulating protein YaaA (DUF328/UPF0246 family)
MLILLPPSEGKAPPARRGRPVDLDALSVPELTAARRKLVDALIETSGRADGAEVLGLGPSRLAELESNRRLLDLPARPAAEIYAGVLYAALDLSGLPSAARRRANLAVRVQSALWGPVRLTDRIPPYRLSIGARLPGIGPLAGFWNRELAGVFGPRAGELVVDCRSSGYAAAWRSPEPAKLVRVTAMTEKDGRRSVVSHFAKHTRGLVARMLLEAPRTPRSPQDAARVVAGRARCELTGSDRTGWELAVVTDAQGQPQPA